MGYSVTMQTPRHQAGPASCHSWCPAPCQGSPVTLPRPSMLPVLLGHPCAGPGWGSVEISQTALWGPAPLPCCPTVGTAACRHPYLTTCCQDPAMQHRKWRRYVCVCAGGCVASQSYCWLLDTISPSAANAPASICTASVQSVLLPRWLALVWQHLKAVYRILPSQRHER